MKYVAASLCFIGAGVNGIGCALSNTRAIDAMPVVCCILAGFALICLGIYDDYFRKKKDS